jgi:hypothetical protein
MGAGEDGSLKNRVGSVVPSAEDIQQLMKDIETFAAKIEELTLMPSAEERQRTTKMRAAPSRLVVATPTPSLQPAPPPVGSDMRIPVADGDEAMRGKT